MAEQRSGSRIVYKLKFTLRVRPNTHLAGRLVFEEHRVANLVWIGRRADNGELLRCEELRDALSDGRWLDCARRHFERGVEVEI